MRDVAQPLELVVARAAVDHVDHRDAATRPHHSRHLPRDRLGAGQVVEREAAHGDVEGAVHERHRRGVALHEQHVAGALLLGAAAAGVQHLAREVEHHELAGAAGQAAGEVTRATADVEHGLLRSEREMVADPAGDAAVVEEVAGPGEVRRLAPEFAFDDVRVVGHLDRSA